MASNLLAVASNLEALLWARNLVWMFAGHTFTMQIPDVFELMGVCTDAVAPLAVGGACFGSATPELIYFRAFFGGHDE